MSLICITINVIIFAEEKFVKISITLIIAVHMSLFMYTVRGFYFHARKVSRAIYIRENYNIIVDTMREKGRDLT